MAQGWRYDDVPAERGGMTTNTERVARLARSFSQEWLRPDNPDLATEALVVTLTTVMTAFYAAAKSADERDTLKAEREARIELRVPFEISGRLGIGAEAWVEILDVEKRGTESRNNDRSGISLSWRTFKLALAALRHCGEKHYVNPPHSKAVLPVLEAPTPSEKESVAWLVALPAQNQWWTGRGDEWTSAIDGTKLDPALCAIRFARKEDAERAIGWLLEKQLARGCRAEEHIWL